ncbi:MAG: hypothetical protein II655_01145, partial [Thermoguttaceae bacterium]|nr:hypothetical protein [Thermoguttaceae bacterium]
TTIRLCAFLFLVAVVAAVIFYRRVDDEVAARAKIAINETFPNLDVAFESARLDAARGVRLRNVEWRQKDAPTKAAPILAVDELRIDFPLGLKTAVARQKTAPTRIVFERPVLRLSADPVAMRREIELLAPAPSESDMPRVELNNAAIELRAREEAVLFSGLSLVFETPDESRDAQPAQPMQPAQPDDAPTEDTQQTDAATRVERAQIDRENDEKNNDQASGDATKDQAPPDPIFDAVQTTRFRIVARAANATVEALDLEAEIGDVAWACRGRADACSLAAIARILNMLKPNAVDFARDLQGSLSFDFRVGGEEFDFNALRYRVDGALQNGFLATANPPRTLADVEAQFHMTEDSLEIARASALCGRTAIKAAFRRLGSAAAPTSAALRVKFENAPLDDETLKELAREAMERMPSDGENELETLVDFLDDYDFQAVADVDLAVEKSEKTDDAWRPTKIVVEGRDAAVSCNRFPYKLEGLRGALAMDAQGALDIALQSPDEDVKLAGRFENVLNDPKGKLDVSAKKQPIDAKLLAALPDACRDTIAKLRPSGYFDAKFRVAFDRTRWPDDPLRVEAA